MGSTKKKAVAKSKAAKPSAAAQAAAKAMLQPLFDLQPSMELLTKLNQNMEKVAAGLDALKQWMVAPSPSLPGPTAPPSPLPSNSAPEPARQVLLESVPDATADATEVKV